jgi:DNA-binding response OmpR family regulator
MKTDEPRTILSIDDDPDLTDMITLMLETEGHRVVTAKSAFTAMEVLASVTPDLILLDLMMPGIDGFALCDALQRSPATSRIPVVFVTARTANEDRSRAFAAGAVGYLAKPFERHQLVDTVRAHIGSAESTWSALPETFAGWNEQARPATFEAFKERLAVALNLAPTARVRLDAMTAAGMYDGCGLIGMSEQEFAKRVAEYLGLPYVHRVQPQRIRLGVLPAAFCKRNDCLAMQDEQGPYFAVANPFNLELVDSLARLAGAAPRLMVTEPAMLALVFESLVPEAVASGTGAGSAVVSASRPQPWTPPSEPSLDRRPAPPVQQSGSILLVEDDIDTRELVVHLLSAEGYDVVPVVHGAQALLQLGHRRFALIITDVGMPYLGGIDLIRLLAEQGIETPVVFLTAHGEEAERALGFRLGAADYITKPVIRSVLLSHVAEVLRRNPPQD